MRRTWERSPSGLAESEGALRPCSPIRQLPGSGLVHQDASPGLSLRAPGHGRGGPDNYGVAGVCPDPVRRACGPVPVWSLASPPHQGPGRNQDTEKPISSGMEPKWSVSSKGRNSPFFFISKADSLECALVRALMAEEASVIGPAAPCPRWAWEGGME